MENALDIAILLLKTKEKRRVKKKNRFTFSYTRLVEERGSLEIEDARFTSVLHSSMRDRLHIRREAVCQKNDVERTLVKEALRQFLRREAIISV